MDTKQISHSPKIKNVIFGKYLTGISSFTKVINVPFQVRAVVVKNISYRYLGQDADIEDGVLSIRSDLVDNQIMGTFLDGQSNHPEIIFPVDKTVAGTFNFQILNVNETLVADSAGDLFIALTFLG